MARKRKKIGYSRKYSKKPCRAGLSKIKIFPSDAFFANFCLLENTNNDEQVTECKDTIDTNELIDSDGHSANEFYVILDKGHKYNPQHNLDEFVSGIQNNLFSKLKSDSSSIENDQFFSIPSSKDIKFISIYDSDVVSDSPRIKTCIRVTEKMKLDIFVHSKPLSTEHLIWLSVKKNCYTVQQLENVIKELCKYSICWGNKDADLQSLKYNNKRAYKEEIYISSTIRSVSCCLLINQRSERCMNCKTYRKTLIKMKSRKSNVKR
jgi:hypothetical protein